MNLLYRWPDAAQFGSRISKEKFYQHGTIPAAVREKIVAEVRRITWAYKLAEATVNLPGSDVVPEIQVFRIDAKDTDVSEPVLTAIDKAIPFPIVFEISRGQGEAERIRMVAAHKQLGSDAPRLSAYYSTGWQPADTERRPLPTVITLPALYTALLEPLTPVAVRPGEDVSEVAAKLDAARMLEREIAALERKLRTEPQFNRKIELRRTLKTKQAELDALR
ncbi:MULTISPECIES: DUF4391 domain-containing protein [Nocardiaceae]|uniref:DUF4391 domain-containing protein n=1 Tax=Rhodococcoides kroppenstedtii TaxID=293050 RepID=A0ABS7NX45_9NOCA|nr:MULTISPECIES: DUF4391 domain-containing protein [Rhodococcus]MBY6313537.1 DUF4391 domain-containing protein [Rhodococcus kroppenstedtii]MBY6321457.1 DUF4391 domain-containing protein [Rhodococcus kroppenstedtii]MBY6400155.1 DUF4391 domain-containing protein [Rhodococcus kroppenstedtii]